MFYLKGIVVYLYYPYITDNILSDQNKYFLTKGPKCAIFLGQTNVKSAFLVSAQNNCVEHALTHCLYEGVDATASTIRTDKGGMPVFNERLQKGISMTEPAQTGISYEVLISIRKLIRAIDLHSRYLSKHFGLTGPQLLILRELSQAGAMSLKEMATTVSLSQATLTGITDRLEKRRLITKMKSEFDRRRVIIQPTDACRQLLAQAPPPIQESFLNQFDKLKDWEQSMILSSLQRLVQMIDAKDIKAAPVLTAGPIGNTTENTE